jgi:hypothetical protein
MVESSLAAKAAGRNKQYLVLKYLQIQLADTIAASSEQNVLLQECFVAYNRYSGLARVLTGPVAVVAVCFVGVASSPAHAGVGSLGQSSTYDLTAEITSFRSWIIPNNTPHNATLGSTVLTDSGVTAGTYQGSQYDWSNTIQLNTPSVAFGYDPAAIAGRRLNGFSVLAGGPVTVAPGVSFDLATLSFTNGQWFYKADVGVHFVATDVATGATHVYDDIAEITSVSSSPVDVDSTGLPIYDPYAEADYFTLLGHPEFGSVRVFEAIAQPPGNPGSTGSIEFVAKIGSLDPVGFTAPSGGAFLDSSITAGLGDPHGTTSVPEPSSTAVFIGALVLLIGGRLARPFIAGRLPA